jgi:hypothetical protein
LLELAACEALARLRIIEHSVGENHWDRAHLVETRDLHGRQRRLYGGEVVLKLRERARSNDRERALRPDPGDGDLTSRALAKTDPALADEVLEAVRKIVSAAYKIERARIE